MIVDDDKDVRDVIEFILTEEGIEVVSAGNGREALELLLSMGSAESYPELLIVDNLMPIMSGVELIQTIKRKYAKELGEIPIAFSSALGEIVPELKDFPELMSLHKPMELDDLIALVRKAPAKSRGQIDLDSISS